MRLLYNALLSDSNSKSANEQMGTRIVRNDKIAEQVESTETNQKWQKPCNMLSFKWSSTGKHKWNYTTTLLLNNVAI